MARRKKGKRTTERDHEPHASPSRTTLKSRVVGTGSLLVLFTLLVVVIWFALRGDRSATPIQSERPNSTSKLDSHAATSGNSLRTEPPEFSGANRIGDDLELLETVQVTPNLSTQWRNWDNPETDGWDTEAFHTVVKKQLAAFAQLMSRPDIPIPLEKLRELVSADFTCGELTPANLQAVHPTNDVTVEYADRENFTDASSDASANDRRHSGVKGLARAWKDISSRFSSSTPARVHFKVFRVLPSENTMTTLQLVEISGPTTEGALEQHATWRISWDTSNANHPRIRSIDVEQFEQLSLNHPRGRLFADCTESVLARNDFYQSQLLHGYEYWLQRMQENRYWFVLGTPGVAVGDVNGDGLEDIYLCQEEGLPNRLLLHDVDGTARDVSAEWGVDWLQWSRSALLVDLDNDGDCDLAVAIVGGILLAENEAGRSFRIRHMLRTADDTTSLSAVDYDQDGRLDLYVCAYYPDNKLDDVTKTAMATGSQEFVIHDANTGGRNSLFRNDISEDQQWSFSDVTQDVGLDVNNRRFSLAAAWEDYDNDGDQDLYVANDFGVNCLYRSQLTQESSPAFEEVAMDAGAEDRATGMSVSWGDYDRDGWMDIYVSNMFSSAGNRVAFQQHFGQSIPGVVRKHLQRFARGNTLLAGLGSHSDGAPHRFDDVTEQSGASMGRWAWASSFVDLNNDGWQDLLVANGYITAKDKGDL